MRIVLICLSFLLSSVFSTESEPGNYELLVRADQFRAYKIPSLTKMPNMTPSCYKEGMFSFRYWHVQGEIKRVVSLFNGVDFVSSKDFDSDFVVGDTFLSDSGAVFAVNERFFSIGAFLLKPSGEQEKIVDPNDYVDLRSVSRPALYKGLPFFRGLHKNGLRSLYLGKEKLVSEEAASSKIAYIFLPTVKEEEFAVRFNYGDPGQVNAKNPDEIFLYTNDEFKSVVKDNDLDKDSDFLDFDSSPVPDGRGGVLFIGKTKNEGRSLWHFIFDVETQTRRRKLIYSEDMGLGSLEYFKPAIGVDKIVFRLIKNNKRSLIEYSRESKDFKVLVSQGDALKTNEENTRVIDRDKWPAFSGSPCVSNDGEVFFHAVLEESNTLENKGSGIFKINQHQ